MGPKPVADLVDAMWDWATTHCRLAVPTPHHHSHLESDILIPNHARARSLNCPLVWPESDSHCGLSLGLGLKPPHTDATCRIGPHTSDNAPSKTISSMLETPSLGVCFIDKGNHATAKRLNLYGLQNNCTPLCCQFGSSLRQHVGHLRNHVRLDFLLPSTLRLPGDRPAQQGYCSNLEAHRQPKMSCPWVRDSVSTLGRERRVLPATDSPSAAN